MANTTVYRNSWVFEIDLKHREKSWKSFKKFKVTSQSNTFVNNNLLKILIALYFRTLIGWKFKKNNNNNSTTAPTDNVYCVIRQLFKTKT